MPRLRGEPRLRFPEPLAGDPHGVAALGADFSPQTLLDAYRQGFFPWPQSVHSVPWCSPLERAIYPLEREDRWSRSLRRRLRTHPYRISHDEAFADIMHAAGDVRHEGTWIIPEMIAGYTRLFQLGFAHSVEIWRGGGDEEELVGGIYGVAIGGAFCGESMFHRETDASKLAFVELVRTLRRGGFTLFDVQLMTPHLESLGCVAVSREAYLERLGGALEVDAYFDRDTRPAVAPSSDAGLAHSGG